MKQIEGQISLFNTLNSPKDEPLPCDSCGYQVKGCCDYPCTPDDYCVLGDKWIPKKVTPEWTCAFTTPVIFNGKPAFQTEDGQVVNLGDEKPVCQFSGHVCNKQSIWEVADSLDDKDTCPHVCCRKCGIKYCGARCNGSEEPSGKEQA